MKIFISVFVLAVVTLLSFAAVLSASASRGTDEHTEWIERSLKEIEGVKIGMTRVDLMKVFNEEGGISTRTSRRYAYRDCPYIKVDVEFEAVGATEDKLSEHPNDKITKISKPFLERSIID